ncbi:hypothetical protein MNAN1_002036 [Malassezia nana]|uniref:holo-[acyl-carrier-protein] synthase n=1 Tax=Malassezia nana TaxID=180528 RepID=A0AAF0EIG5_9BASI|nr:hypothetical protein MNAN1_002036 [Malassezia nana]
MDLGVRVWAVDVSAWNGEPWTRVHGSSATDPWEQDVTALLGHDARETQRVRRYLRGIDRVRSFIARVLPRLLLVQEGECAWQDVCIETTAKGRPYMAAPAGLAYDYNLTHDGDWVVMAFSLRERVGVDVMQMALPSFEESSTTFATTMAASMTPAERAWVAAPAEEQGVLERLLHVWTYKEALTKNRGEGLGFDFAQIQVPLGRDGRLWISGEASDAYRFLEVMLPSGAAHPTHAGSLLVMALGPQQVMDMPSSIVSCDEAQRAGWLRIWTCDELVREARYRSSGV